MPVRKASPQEANVEQTYQSILPSWLQPDAQPEPGEPWYKTQLRQAVRDLGLDSPTKTSLNLVDPELIAGVSPSRIPELKQYGAQLINKVKSMGLPQIAMGRYSDPAKFPAITNLSPRMIQALEFAQQKYPRLFGHLADITNTDALTYLRTGVSAFGESGASSQHPLVQKPVAPPTPKYEDYGFDKLKEYREVHKKWNEDFNAWRNALNDYYNNTKFTRLGLSPSTMDVFKADPAEVIGHELLHSADRLTKGEALSNEQYQFFNQLYGGYNTNSMEVRARLAGENFRKKFEEYLAKQAAGGQ